MDAEKTNLTSELEGLGARDRERRMLEVIGRIARGEILPAAVDNEADLRQLAYLAAISRRLCCWIGRPYSYLWISSRQSDECSGPWLQHQPH